MGTFSEGRVVYVAERPEDRIRRPIAVGGYAADSDPRAGDRWTDKDGDDWLVVWTDDGPRLKLCNGERPPPLRSIARSVEYVFAEYGPLVLHWRAGRQTLVKILMKKPEVKK